MHHHNTIKKFNSRMIFRPFMSDVTASFEAFQRKVRPQDIAQLIDHTNLWPNATREDIRKLVDKAKEYRFASVCVNPSMVGYAAELLETAEDASDLVLGINVLVATVVGFPSGATTSATKAYEAKEALNAGATEIDMVVNTGLLSIDYFESTAFFDDIAAVAKTVATHPGAMLKCIFETAYLTPQQVENASYTVVKVAEQFPDIRFMTKTSTGFALSKLLVPKYDGTTAIGARVEDLEIMARAQSGSSVGIKASGGIKTYDDALRALYAMGARTVVDLRPEQYRIGTSSGIQIVKG